jgi:hypothetical protein
MLHKRFLSAGCAPLFKAENELEQLSCIISVLGTYDPDQWGAKHWLPDFRKIRYAPSSGRPLQALLPHASPAAIELVYQCLSCASALLTVPDHESVKGCSEQVARVSMADDVSVR